MRMFRPLDGLSHIVGPLGGSGIHSGWKDEGWQWTQGCSGAVTGVFFFFGLPGSFLGVFFGGLLVGLARIPIVRF